MAVLSPGRCLDGFVPHFSCRYTPSDPKISILDPKSFKFYRKSGPPDPPLLKIPDFPETIPAYLNFAEFYRFSFYPKKLSYSSSNAYIKKIRVRLLGKPTCVLKNLKNA